MPINKDGIQDLKKPLIIMAFLIVVLWAIEMIYLMQFNSQQRVLTSYLTSNDVSMAIHGRGSTTDTWKKRDFDWNGRRMDLTGQIYDADLHNDSDFQIEGWELRLNIEQDCFLNNAWCGTVEIHQHVADGEKVQTLDLRAVAPEEVSLDYYYDGDILIPLSQGDYIVYRPSAADKEVPVEKFAALTTGFILYYLDAPNLGSYTVNFHFNRKITDGYSIYLIGGLLAIWLIMLIGYIASAMAYSKASKEMALRKSGIMSMSDLFALIYIVDLEAQKLIPVSANKEIEAHRARHKSAAEQLRAMFDFGCTKEYRELAMDFCRLDTLADRLGDRNTVMLEYISQNYGWCRARFLAMERGLEGQLEKALFMVQIVDEEKREMENIVGKITQAERNSQVQSIFFANITQEISTVANNILELSSKMPQEEIIRNDAQRLLGIMDKVKDMSLLETGRLELQLEEYSLEELARTVYNRYNDRQALGQLELGCQLAPGLPRTLQGDCSKIRQILDNLLEYGIRYTDKGKVKLSVYGKAQGDKVHLLFSVKDTGIGIPKEEVGRLNKNFAEFAGQGSHALNSTELGLELSNGILQMMGSQLHAVSIEGQGSELYFEVEQAIIDAEPVGKIDFASEA